MAVFYPEEAGHHYHHNVITMCTCVFVTRHSSLLCMLKNHRGNVATRIDHVQSGAKQSTPNPRKKGKENKTKQSKTKNSTTQQSTTNTTKIHQTFFMIFFRLGAKKKYPIVTMPLDVTMPVDSVIHTTGIFVGREWNGINLPTPQRESTLDIRWTYPRVDVVHTSNVLFGGQEGWNWNNNDSITICKPGDGTVTRTLYANLVHTSKCF